MDPGLNTYKELQDFGNLELLARQVVEGFITGLHKSPFHGFSVEFAEHRLYNSGESIKNIDWKLFGRTDKLFVKRFEEETNLRCQLVLDISSSMHYPREDFNKIRFSILASAALIYLLKRQRDAFGLTFFAEDIELSTAAKSTSAHQKYLFTELERLLLKPERNKKTDISNALHTIAEQIHKRSLIVIFSDMLSTDSSALDEVFSALQHLKYRKHEVILFNVLDHKNELDFSFENRPYHFVDLETGQEIKVQPNQVQETYLSAFNAVQQQLKVKCGQYGIDLIDADINEGFYKVLHSYLIKRNKVV